MARPFWMSTAARHRLQHARHSGAELQDPGRAPDQTRNRPQEASPRTAGEVPDW